MAGAPEVMVRPGAPTAVGWHALAGAMGPDLPGLVAEVERGEAVPFVVEVAGEPVCWFALRIEVYGGQRECVVVAAAGNLPGVDLTRTVLPWIEMHAAAVGCRSLRIHTQRRGLMAKLMAMQYGEVEIVLRKDLTDGRQ